MTPNDVNEQIIEFLTSYDFSVIKGTTQYDVDIKAFKCGIELNIESRGNQAYNIREPKNIMN